jgi:hypothetical protein
MVTMAGGKLTFVVVVVVIVRHGLALTPVLVAARRHGQRLRLRRVVVALWARHRLVLVVPGTDVFLKNLFAKKWRKIGVFDSK